MLLLTVTPGVVPSCCLANTICLLTGLDIVGVKEVAIAQQDRFLVGEEMPTGSGSESG